MKYIWILLIIGIIFITQQIEHFSNESEFSEYREDTSKIIVSSDAYDKKYTRLVNIVRNEPSIYRHDIIKIKDIVNFENARVLDAGCGLGRHLEIIKEVIPNIMIEGIDKSKNMINQCKIRNPEIELLCTSLTIPEIYKPHSLTHILSLHETLNHNTPTDISTILNNFHKWLIPDGYFIIHIIDPTRLDPAPRAHSQYFVGEDNAKHSLTYFESFTHEAWWEKDEKQYWYRYCEKYIFPNEQVKIQTISLWIPPVNKMLHYITRHNFKLKEIIELHEIEVSQFTLYVFKKK